MESPEKISMSYLLNDIHWVSHKGKHHLIPEGKQTKKKKDELGVMYFVQIKQRRKWNLQGQPV